jgi:cobalt-zinc-cadmium efflux system protein
MSEHKHENYGSNRTALAIALSITALMMVVEFAGGILSGSLALLSDAAHMLTDTGALALALFALWFSRRPATSEKTYGFYRFEILSALLNGSVLILIAGFIFYEAFQRIINPPEVKGALMLGVAAIGLVANLAGAFILSKGSRENLNIRAALWHIISDALSSVGVIVGGIIILFTGFFLVDPIIGFIIGILVLRGALELVLESVNILLEATPKDIDLDEVTKEIKKIECVKDIHDLHIWTITSGLRACSAHVLVADMLTSKCAEISSQIKELMHDRFNISHTTLQFESETCKECFTCAPEREGK